MGAHPRVCGENDLALCTCKKATGSSPRVRGKLALMRSTVAFFGLIPACAGKTAPGLSIRKRTKAHPRVCGENAFLIRPATKPGGSSPRVRGKHC